MEEEGFHSAAKQCAHRGSQRAVPVSISARRGSQYSAAPATTSANEPHAQKSGFTAPVTKSELVKHHDHVQSAALATKSALRSKTVPIPCACRLWTTKARVSLAPAAKSDQAHGTTTTAQSLEAPAADT